MKELELKYGCNPNQKPARLFMADGSELPVEVVNGRPGYINFMDALNSWQLVRALRAATGTAAAASFKHVSPAGAAIGRELSDIDRIVFHAPADISPLASAYARARGADRLCSYGDWAALSDICDADTARLLLPEVSDGVIAPGYTDEALELLRAKRGGGYNVVRIDQDYEPAAIERRDIFGIRFEQGYNSLPIGRDCLGKVVTKNTKLTPEAQDDLLLSLITLKYTQSNSVCYVKDGQTIGVGAGQQSRIHCTRLAGDKANIWWLRRHPRVLELRFDDKLKRAERDNEIDRFIGEELSANEKADWIAKLDGVALGSDAFFPFGDNIERAAKSGVKYVAQPGGSIRDDNVIEAADKYGMVMSFTGIRLFHH